MNNPQKKLEIEITKPKPDSTKCPTCGKTKEPSYRICYKCHAKEKLKCPLCGNKKEYWQKLCYHCYGSEKNKKGIERVNVGLCWNCGKTIDKRKSALCKKCSSKISEDKKKQLARGLAYLKYNRARYIPCQECGSAGDTEWHHDDYDKPYDVIPLCKRCHDKKRSREK